MTGERILPNLNVLTNNWLYGSDGWGTAHDRNLAAIDALMFLSVLSKSLTTPPSALVAGNRFIVAANATGPWATKDNEIAVYLDGLWTFYTPDVGWRAYVEDMDADVRFLSGAWHVVSAAASTVAGGSGGTVAGGTGGTSTTTGGTGGTTTAPSGPRVVQCAAFAGTGTSVTLPVAPVNGNGLFCLASHYRNAVTPGAGWTLVSDNNGSNDGIIVLYRAASNDGATLTPIASSDMNNIAVFEVSGIDATKPQNLCVTAGETPGASVAATPDVSAGTLILGAAARATAADLPAISDPTAVLLSPATNASASRSIQPFYYKSASPAVPLTATWPEATASNYLMLFTVAGSTTTGGTGGSTTTGGTGGSTTTGGTG